jgi:hypothetical protein
MTSFHTLLAFSIRILDKLGSRVLLAGGQLQQALVVVGHAVRAAHGLQVSVAVRVALVWNRFIAEWMKCTSYPEASYST